MAENRPLYDLSDLDCEELKKKYPMHSYEFKQFGIYSTTIDPVEYARLKEGVEKLQAELNKTPRISGVWIRRIGDNVECLIEINGQYRVATTEAHDGAFSHCANAACWKDWPIDPITTPKD